MLIKSLLRPHQRANKLPRVDLAGGNLKLGRDYTNCLVFDQLGGEDKKALERDKLDLASMNAIALEKAKLDVRHQIEVTKDLGLDHIELDADSPNPYVSLDGEEKRKIRDLAESNGIDYSVHLPYSYVGGSICAMQESDRLAALDLHKKTLQFAADVGAKYANVHPGSTPFWHRAGKYKELIHEALVKSLLDLGKMAKKLNVDLIFENNTAFDGIYCEVPDCLSVVRELREKGVELYFNLDIGHWFTRADTGSSIPDPPESVMEDLPSEYLKELHLNDYVPGKKMFHPPIHLGLGPLKRANLERYAEIVKGKGVEVVVLETALKSVEQVVNRRELLKEETKFIKDIFG